MDNLNVTRDIKEIKEEYIIEKNIYETQQNNKAITDENQEQTISTKLSPNYQNH